MAGIVNKVYLICSIDVHKRVKEKNSTSAIQTRRVMSAKDFLYYYIHHWEFAAVIRSDLALYTNNPSVPYIEASRFEYLAIITILRA